MSPLKLFLISRNIIPSTAHDDMPLPSLCDILRQEENIKCNDLECLLALQDGNKTDTDLCTVDESSGLLPFMLAASQPTCHLDTVYMLAMESPHLIV